MEIKFLRQSIRSDYCAVYSCGMLLGFLGLSLDRKAVLRLCGINTQRRKSFTGLTHQEITRVLRSTRLLSKIKWKVLNQPKFQKVRSTIEKQLNRTNLPTLVTFGAIHLTKKIQCTHAVLAVSVPIASLHLLDPLGQTPEDDRTWNVVFRAETSRMAAFRIDGCCYCVDPNEPFSILTWELPP